jgi:hypothetical protein
VVLRFAGALPVVFFADAFFAEGRFLLLLLRVAMQYPQR